MFQRSEISVEESAYEHHIDSGVEIEDNSSGSSCTTSTLSRIGSMTSLTASRDSLVSSVDNDDGQRYAVLCYDQVKRLDQVMREVMPINGRGNFPTLEVQLRDLVQVVRAKLEKVDINVADIRLNGGAASYVLSSSAPLYNDLDLIFTVDLSSHKNYDKVKQAVLSSLLEFMPDKVNRQRITSCSLKEAYVHKMVKVTTEGDRWSLISLSNIGGRNVELKFVDAMRRQFEFSVDSFQIALDSLLLFHECAAMPMSDTFYPSIVGESVYGDFHEALYHLDSRLIATRTPEEIRGGGLLKYCDLLVRDYHPADRDHIKSLERYMCSRFFIDFSDINQQRTKLERYLINHFIIDDVHSKYDYLTTLHRVVNDSTVCLMGHERRQTLALIEELACRVYFQEQQRLYMPKQYQFELQPMRFPSTTTAPNFHGPHIQYMFGAAPTTPGYFVTPYVTSPPPMPSQQNFQQQPCTCSWMPCT